jgi:DNA-binding phage protein
LFDNATYRAKMARMIIKKLAKAIRQSDKSRYRIAKDTGIDHTVLFRIVNGGSCSIRTADKLCKYLGLDLVKRERGDK